MSARLIFALAVTNFLEACANLFSLGVYNHEVEYYGLCYTQGTLLQFTEVATFGWVMAITFNLYFVVVFNKKIKILEYIYHGLVWGFAALAAGVPWVSKAYGIAGIWCWITWEYQVYRWVLYYLPLFLVIIGIVVLYSLIYAAIISSLKFQGKESDKEAQQLLAKLRAYPIVFFIVYAFSITNRIYDWLSPDDSFPLYVLESITTPLIGFVNSIIYATDPEIKDKWKKQLFEMGFCIKWTAPTHHEEFQNEIIEFDTPPPSVI